MSSKVVHVCKKCRISYITLKKEKKCIFCGSDKIKIKKVGKSGDLYEWTV
jgi:hypothetical protein